MKEQQRVQLERNTGPCPAQAIDHLRTEVKGACCQTPACEGEMQSYVYPGTYLDITRAVLPCLIRATARCLRMSWTGMRPHCEDRRLGLGSVSQQTGLLKMTSVVDRRERRKILKHHGGISRVSVRTSRPSASTAARLQSTFDNIVNRPMIDSQSIVMYVMSWRKDRDGGQGARSPMLSWRSYRQSLGQVYLRIVTCRRRQCSD